MCVNFLDYCFNRVRLGGGGIDVGFFGGGERNWGYEVVMDVVDEMKGEGVLVWIFWRVILICGEVWYMVFMLGGGYKE